MTIANDKKFQEKFWLYKKSLSAWLEKNIKPSDAEFLDANSRIYHYHFGRYEDKLNWYAEFRRKIIVDEKKAEEISAEILKNDDTLREAGYEIVLSFDSTRRAKVYRVDCTYKFNTKEPQKIGLKYTIGYGFDKELARKIISKHYWELLSDELM